MIKKLLDRLRKVSIDTSSNTVSPKDVAVDSKIDHQYVILVDNHPFSLTFTNPGGEKVTGQLDEHGIYHLIGVRPQPTADEFAQIKAILEEWMPEIVMRCENVNSKDRN